MESEKGSLNVNKLVEYIKQQEFPFDTHDDFEEILNHFGIAFEPDSKDCALLSRELQKMVEQEQTSEITRAVLHEQGLDDDWRWDDEER